MKPIRRRAVPVAVALMAALALLLGACGGTQDAAAQYRRRANSICADGNKAIDHVARDFGPNGPTPEQLAKAAPQVPRLMTAELDRLAALHPPADLADAVARMLAEFRRVVGTMEQQGTAFFEHGREHFAQAYAMADDLGLHACAQ
jgi:hypothetical protein